MEIENLFVEASRLKIRFATPIGELTTEQIWDLPLRSRSGVLNLNTVAQMASAALKETSEENFVDATKTSPERRKREVALEAVKYIIKVRLDEEEAAKKRAENKEKRTMLFKALTEKREGALSAKSEEELLKEIASLEE